MHQDTVRQVTVIISVTLSSAKALPRRPSGLLSSNWDHPNMMMMMGSSQG
jgi:hypothetical protein